jgi:dTMP kinase
MDSKSKVVKMAIEFFYVDEPIRIRFPQKFYSDRFIDMPQLLQYDSADMGPLKTGIFITFEGGEGAGKTTLIDSIAQELTSEGYSVLKTREPGGTKLGEEIRNILLQHKEPLAPYTELSLFLASRAQHVAEVIGPALEAGKVVLCDRFNDSSVAYQGAARGLGMEKVRTFCEFICQGINPQLTIYLNLDPEIGMARVAKARKKDRIEAETLMFHKRIQEAYIAIHRSEQARFRLINAELSPERVFQEAMKLIDPLILKHV